MKKLLLLLSTFMFSITAHALMYQEGKHYNELDLPKSAQPIVEEYFSFYCNHCYHFEPLIEQLKAALPVGVKFQKKHVSFMGGRMGPSMSKAYATMVSLQIEDKMTPLMFNRIHTMQRAPNNDADLRQIFLDEGVDAKKFNSTFNSFAIDSMTRNFDNGFKKAKLRGVPALIVNGKYHVNTKSISNSDELNRLINHLLTI